MEALISYVGKISICSLRVQSTKINIFVSSKECKIERERRKQSRKVREREIGKENKMTNKTERETEGERKKVYKGEKETK